MVMMESHSLFPTPRATGSFAAVEAARILRWDLFNIELYIHNAVAVQTIPKRLSLRNGFWQITVIDFL